MGTGKKVPARRSVPEGPSWNIAVSSASNFLSRRGLPGPGPVPSGVCSTLSGSTWPVPDCLRTGR